MFFIFCVHSASPRAKVLLAITGIKDDQGNGLIRVSIGLSKISRKKMFQTFLHLAQSNLLSNKYLLQTKKSHVGFYVISSSMSFVCYILGTEAGHREGIFHLKEYWKPKRMLMWSHLSIAYLCSHNSTDPQACLKFDFH